MYSREHIIRTLSAIKFEHDNGFDVFLSQIVLGPCGLAAVQPHSPMHEQKIVNMRMAAVTGLFHP
jgi:hypothetical protein